MNDLERTAATEIIKRKDLELRSLRESTIKELAFDGQELCRAIAAGVNVDENLETIEDIIVSLAHLALSEHYYPPIDSCRRKD